MLYENTFIAPYYDESEINAVSDYFSNKPWLMEFKETRTLEEFFCEYYSVKNTIMTTSCTVSIFMCCLAIDLCADDEVIVSSYTQVATANGAKICGAKIKFADIDEKSGTLRLDEIEKNLSEKTKAIIITSINGRYPDNINDVVRFCKKNKIYLIEDSAQAFDCNKIGKKIGTFGDFGCFSFGMAKTISCGQGGLIITNNNDMAEKIKSIKNFGRITKEGEIYDIFGLNFKITDIQSVFLKKQIEKKDYIIENKNRIYQRYMKNLHDCCKFLEVEKDSHPVFSEIFLKNKDERQRVCDKLKNEKIGFRHVYYPLNNSPYYSQFEKYETPIAEKFGDTGLLLPSNIDLLDTEIDYISEKIKEVL